MDHDPSQRSSGRGEASVSSELAQLFLRGVAGGRRDAAQELARAAGLDPELLRSPHRRIAAERFHQLWQTMEQASGDPNFGLHLGQLPSGLPLGHVLWAVLCNSATVGQALERFCRYHDLMADVVRPQLSPATNGSMVFSVAPHGAGLRLHRQHTECILGIVVTLVRHLSGERSAGQVSFSHPRPADVAEHLRAFGPELRFDQPADQLVLPRRIVQKPLAAADSELLVVLEQYAQKVLRRLQRGASWSDRVFDLLSRALCDGKPRLDDLARKLSVSPRSLQDKLKAEGTSFQRVLDTVRRELATAYLGSSELTVCEIAFLLGYADQSAFNHAFKKWTGCSPLAFRDRQPPKAKQR